MCALPSLRSACASAQSDQSLGCTSEDALDSWLPQKKPCKDLSDCADAQAGLSLRWTHMQSCRKCFAQTVFSFKLYYGRAGHRLYGDWTLDRWRNTACSFMSLFRTTLSFQWTPTYHYFYYISWRNMEVHVHIIKYQHNVYVPCIYLRWHWKIVIVDFTGYSLSLSLSLSLSHQDLY